MLTIFGTILLLITKQIYNINSAREFVKLSPHWRFAEGLDFLEDDEINEKYRTFLDDYEGFLCLKEVMEDNQEISQTQFNKIRHAASRYSDFIYRTLTHRKIESEYTRYLIL